MRNSTLLSVIVAFSFLMFSFESSARETNDKVKLAEFENFLILKKNVFKVAVDAESINQFYKKYPKLKKYQNDVLDLYKKKQYNLIWYDDKSVSEFGSLLYHKVHLINDQGIKATMPYIDVIDDIFNENVSNKLPQIDTELLLSNMYVFYASNVYSGVDAATLKKIGWFLPAKNISYAKILDSLMVDPGRLNKDENLLFGQYYKLQTVLKKYRTIEKNNLWKKIDIDSATYKDLRPFDSGVAVKQIRERLFVVGDLAQDSKREVYDEEMMAGVLKYKKRYGLKLNYAITRDHINQMNEPIGNRIKTIMLNMERCRWIPTDLAQATEYVMVNIPSFRIKTR